MEREKIERAAKEYADKQGDFGTGWYHAVEDFTNGARWRINSVWHKAGEKPYTANLLLLVFTNGVIVTGRYEKWGFSYFTKENVQNAEVEKWAYLADLLPDTRKEAVQ